MSVEPTSAGLLGIHALTALHPGAGTAIGTVDLPVQRERHTGWPTIAGSALKGILRDACREQISRDANLDTLPRHDDRAATDNTPAVVAERKGSGRERANNTLALNELFGPPTAGSSEFAGAVSVTDARLLAYPVRSLKGVFAWITCPAVMERFARDAKMSGFEFDENKLPKFEIKDALSAVALPDCPCSVSDKDDKGQPAKAILLEEFKLRLAENKEVATWAETVAKLLLPTSHHYKTTRERFAKQLVVVHDDDFTHFVKYATEVTARIGLDYETKTVKGGALFYQEFLPTESLFYSVVIVNAARTRNTPRDAGALMTSLGGMVANVPVLQIGGDETTGKGFCSVRLTTKEEPK